MNKLANFLGKPATVLLASPIFKFRIFERSVDEDLPEKYINYTFSQIDFSLVCDNDERILSIFLKSDIFDRSLLSIPFSSNRGEVLGILGTPSKSGQPYCDAILGKYGAWDRFDGPDYLLHIEYKPHEDVINRITFMISESAKK